MPKKKSAAAFKEIFSQVKQPAVKSPRKRGAQKTATTGAAAEAPPPPSGRQSGKSSDPDYTQANVYIRKTTKREVQIALLSKFPDMDMSDLAEQLFSDWLKENE